MRFSKSSFLGTSTLSTNFHANLRRCDVDPRSTCPGMPLQHKILSQHIGYKTLYLHEYYFIDLFVYQATIASCTLLALYCGRTHTKYSNTTSIVYSPCTSRYATRLPTPRVQCHSLALHTTYSTNTELFMTLYTAYVLHLVCIQRSFLFQQHNSR